MSGNQPANPKTRIASLVVLIALAAIAGCKDTATSAPASANSSSGADEAKPPAKRPDSRQDRGNAQFDVAGTTWIGERASARIKADDLKISASRMTRDGDTVKRDALEISIKDYQGPRLYKANMGSMFVRVSINMPKEEGGEADAAKLLTDAIGDSSNILLANADVEITSESGGYIDGRFSLDMPGMPDKAVTGGQFHARIRD